MHRARRLWMLVEPIHAITYFGPETRAAGEQLGLRGFWRTYFAFRAAPLGTVGPDVVAAAFYNFTPAMVARAIPDVWSTTTPEAALAARSSAAATTLRRVAGSAVDELAGTAATALGRVIDAAAGEGRPMFAANRPVGYDDPVAQLWQCCTALREHRGDGHVALLVAERLGGCAAHVLAASVAGTPVELLRDNRGWTAADWDAAAAELVTRGLLDAGGSVTERGRSMRAAIEARTDLLAGDALAPLDDADLDALVAALAPIAEAVLAADLLPFPNPIGLPDPRSAR